MSAVIQKQCVRACLVIIAIHDTGHARHALRLLFTNRSVEGLKRLPSAFEYAYDVSVRNLPELLQFFLNGVRVTLIIGLPGQSETLLILMGDTMSYHEHKQ